MKILPSVCQNYKSEKGCVHGDKCNFRHVEAAGKPSKKSKKGGVKGSVAILTESIYKGVVYFKILVRESLFHVNLESWDRNTPSNSPMAPGKKGSIARYYPKVCAS